MHLETAHQIGECAVIGRDSSRIEHLHSHVTAGGSREERRLAMIAIVENEPLVVRAIRGGHTRQIGIETVHAKRFDLIADNRAKGDIVHVQ
jgi:hypothetical protein